MVQIEPITAQADSASPSVYEIMVDTVELSGVSTTTTQVKTTFTSLPLLLSLREMGLDTEVRGFVERLNRIEQARNDSLNRLRADLATIWSASSWWWGYQHARPQQLHGTSICIRSIQ